MTVDVDRGPPRRNTALPGPSAAPITVASNGQRPPQVRLEGPDDGVCPRCRRGVDEKPYCGNCGLHLAVGPDPATRGAWQAAHNQAAQSIAEARNLGRLDHQQPASGDSAKVRFNKRTALAGAAVTAIVGLGATNVITALNASSADAAHRHQVRALTRSYKHRLAAVRAADAVALKQAVTAQARRDGAHLAAVKQADRRAEQSAVSTARNAGYSSGNAAGQAAGYVNGYSSGNTTGQANGYANGYSTGASDATAQTDATCSNNPSVTWLPYC